MSGGHFNYRQYNMQGDAEEIRGIVDEGGFSPITTQRLLETAEALDRASKMLHRVDWFLSGDDGQDSFNERWEIDGL